MTKAIACLVVLICISARAAPPTNPLGYSALISVGQYTGSGFFLQASNSIYLATARHVLFTRSEGTNPFSLLANLATVKSFFTTSTTNEEDRLTILPLDALLAAGEVRFSTNRDIALVRFGEVSTNNPAVSRWIAPAAVLPQGTGLVLARAETMRLFTEVLPGSDIYLFGYPTSVSIPAQRVIDPGRPLLRKGIVSASNPKTKTLVLDCSVHKGNSGGPVIQVEQVGIGAFRYSLIGIVTEWVPFEEVWENKQFGYFNHTLSNSVYSIVEPIDAILDLVWK